MLAPSANHPILDIQFGNIWTNIDRSVFRQLGAEPGDILNVKISRGDEIVLEMSIPYFRSFGGVKVTEPLVYLNSLNNVSLAINQGSFAEQFGIRSGADWNVSLSAH